MNHAGRRESITQERNPNRGHQKMATHADREGKTFQSNISVGWSAGGTEGRSLRVVQKRRDPSVPRPYQESPHQSPL